MMMSPSTRRSISALAMLCWRMASLPWLAVMSCRSRVARTASTAPTTPATNGSETSGMRRPTMALGPPPARDCARRLGRKPSSRAAAKTRSAVVGATPYSSFMAREAVFRLTPASAATSARVGRPGVVTARPCADRATAGRAPYRSLVDDWAWGMSRVERIRHHALRETRTGRRATHQDGRSGRSLGCARTASLTRCGRFVTEVSRRSLTCRCTC